MSGLEAAAIRLGASIIKSACKLWFGNIGGDAAAEVADLLKGHVEGEIDRRKVMRFFDDCGDIVSARFVHVLEEPRWRGIPDHERNAALLCVRDTLVAASISRDVLYTADLDARTLERHLRPSAVEALRRAQLAEKAERLYHYILRESCAYLTQIIATLPNFQTTSVSEVLKRQTALLDRLQQVLDRLPDRRSIDDFQTDYLRQVSTILDRMELFGARVDESARNYPLTTAYLSLNAMYVPFDAYSRTMAFDSAQWSLRGAFGGTASPSRVTSSSLRIDEALSSERRTLLLGEAGSGKTTLLRWLAVHSARRDLPYRLEHWNSTVPFLVLLRRYVGKPLPRPEEFLDAVGNAISAEMPQGWVQTLLRSGRALVLIDGVDELPASERHKAKQWLRELVTQFGSASFVVTTRPSAVEPAWLSGLDFQVAELASMSTLDIKQFITHWHKAMSEETVNRVERENLREHEKAILASLSNDRHLRRLAVNPLLCALLCALNRELRNKLPRSRMEIYEAALSMLLDKRDRERGVPPSSIDLTKADKIVLLQNLALWLVRNGRSQATTEEATGQFSATVRTLRSADQVPAPDELFRDLLERAGVLRQPVADGVDFLHRTFQEYLAGKAAVDGNFVGELLRNAGDDQWREVVVMAAGHAQPNQCEELLSGLIRDSRPAKARNAHLLFGLIRDSRPAKARNAHLLIALACLQTVRQLDPDVRQLVQDQARTLMPPRSIQEAEALANAGEFVLDLLPMPADEDEASAILHTATLMPGEDSLELISRLVKETGQLLAVDQLMRAWESFDTVEFAGAVMSHVDFGSSLVFLPDELIPGLAVMHNLSSVQVNLSYIAMGALHRTPLPSKLRTIVVDGSGTNAPRNNDLIHVDTSLAEAIAVMRREKEKSIDEQDFERAAYLRDDEKELLALQAMSEITWPGAPDSPATLQLFAFPHEDLRLIHSPSAVRRLVIDRWRKLRGLAGIEHFAHLEELVISMLNDRMVALDGLSECAELGYIHIQADVAQEVDITPLVGLTRLRKVTISRCRLVRVAESVDPAAVARLPIVLEADQAVVGPSGWSGQFGRP